MGVQTSYTAEQSAAYEGQLADDGPSDVLSRLQGEASAGIGFGLVVCQHLTVDGKAILPADANSRPLGITVRSQAYEVGREYIAASNGVQVGAMLNVLRKGRIWVAVEEAVTSGDPFFARHLTAGAERKGAIRKSADASDCLDLTAKGRFLTTQATIGGLAILEVDFTNS
jgi:hypothetical protein